ncbi:hypothetical protein [Intestinibacillus massiliensis]|uniref:hypothetical protein n=1 Tax=Intestinibacillus massiliensis TaxID=1871029 RepID=UPI000B35FBA9|nr:hypothetical protein [Intestinibacillus massiliensis]
MSLAQKKTVAEGMKTIQICVDAYKGREMSGFVYHQTIAGGRRFDNLMQLLLTVEHILEDMDFPRAMNERRSFSKSAAVLSQENAGDEPRTGRLATFFVRMMFRQNASWQGMVTWSEGASEETFRSALELIFLMDSALTAGKE